jgi:DNA-binding CsgD family transcriptional regulator
LASWWTLASAGEDRYILMKIAAPARDLTDHQRKIVQMVAEDLSNKEIAGELGVAGSTVASHLNRIFRKYNIHSRAALASRGIFSLF